MSATTSPASLPNPEPGEPSDVTVAIEAARALWENGDTEEALRWFSRAAEAAEQAGNDRRALDLARMVADLKDGLAASATAQAAAAAPVAPAPPVATAAPAAALPTPPPAPSAPKLVTRPPPPPSARKSMAPTPPPAPSKHPRPPEATTAKSFSGPAVAETTAASQPAPPMEAAPAAKVVQVETAPAAKAVQVETAPAAKAVQAAARNDAGKGERLRVSVKSSVRDPNLLLVRILGTGQSVPSDCHEAFLTAAQSGIDLRSLGE